MPRASPTFPLFSSLTTHNSIQPNSNKTNTTTTTTTKNNTNIPKMPSFFKSSSSKNQTASAATTPAQTPRNSIHEQRIHQGVKMTPEEALYKISHNMMSNAAAGPYVR
ncbi:hypothetical protein BGZ91_008008 [Linnemannia elongata]|nr:hypothetical protein BGZ91_008008 [Linnemannia elongata]